MEAYGSRSSWVDLETMGVVDASFVALSVDGSRYVVDTLCDVLNSPCRVQAGRDTANAGVKIDLAHQPSAGSACRSGR